MRLKIIVLIMVSVLTLMPACQRSVKDTAKPLKTSISDTITGIVVADTIIYEVIISNPNPDDTWATECLSGLHRRSLIDNIFSMVYKNQAVAFNHETNEKLTPRQVKQIEARDGFNRENIGMIQFTEAWYLNPESGTMTKKVLSMVLGYNFYASDGELFGHKPVFRVEMNNSDK
jgi:hypothetical protein